MRADFLAMLKSYLLHPMRIVWQWRHRNNLAEIRRQKADILTK